MRGSNKRQDAGGISSIKRELLAVLLAEEGIELSRKISRRKTSEAPPLSFSQQRLWFLHQIEPESPAYNIPSAVRLVGALNLTSLERSLNEIVRRHEALRTTFTMVDDQPAQVISPVREISIPVTNLEALPATAREAEVQRLASEEALAPFDLYRGPLLRVKLLRVGEQEHVILFTLHHIVSDAWSMGVLIGEFVQLYEAFSARKNSPLPELPIQYADFAAWQREWLTSDALESHLTYWEEKLRGAPSLALSTDKPRPAVQSFRGASLPVNFSMNLAEGLNRLSQVETCTLFMTLLAAFNVLLRRCTGQNDISVGAPIAGRGQVETEPLIGFFVNTLVMRVDLDGAPTFRELLRRVRGVALEAYAHQDAPFEMLVERLQPARGLGHTPLFQVALAMQTAPSRALEIPGLKVSPVGDRAGVAKFELTLDLTETAVGISGTLEYGADLFEPATVACMIDQLRTLLEGVVANPDERISDLPLLGPEQRRQLLAEWNSTAHEYSKESCVHELFEEQVRLRPDAVVVVHGETQLTYYELNARANQLAHYMRLEGVGPNALVGVLMERSVEMVVALLGTLKAGGAYVPLDRSYPIERLSFMLDDARISLLVTEKEFAGEFSPGAARLVRLDTDWEAIAGQSPDNLHVEVDPEHLVYVSYTSGSTGLPKGTAIPHRSVIGFMSQVDYVRFDDSLRFLQYSSISWDALTLELWPALAHGGRCILYTGWMPAPPELARAIKEYSVNAVWITSSLFNAVIDAMPEALSGVAQVMTGGEALSEAHVRRALKLLPETRLINGYGPSECTVFTCCYPIPKDLTEDVSPIPIGKPIGDRMVYLLDRWMNPAPGRATGELCIGGDSLARGYLGRPELTAVKFAPHPYSERAGERLYRSGDLARRRADGQMEFVGRVDDQVKVRGFRIELGEIEAAIARHEAVRECVVLVKQERPTEKRLVAYVATNPERDLHVADLRSYLKQRLPEYMIPSGFVLMVELPLTANRKVDRHKLLAMEPAEASDADFLGPRTVVEEVVAGLWAEALRVERVSVHDNFFEVGGHSLLATQVVSRMRKVFGVDVPLRRLFEEPTVEGLARIIEEGLREEASAAAPPIERAPRDGGLPLSFAQQRLWFLDQLQPGATAYNLPAAIRLKGKLNVASLRRALSEMVRRHEVLRTVFVQIDGAPVQVINEPRQFEMPLLDLSRTAMAEREIRVRRLAKEFSEQPFDLQRGPLFRVKLLKLGKSEHVMLMAMHHIVSDGWSMGVMVREMTALYRAFSEEKLSPLPELSIQYADYAVWERGWLQGAVLESQMEYWRERLGGELPVLELPTDYPRPAIYSHRGGRTNLELSKRLTEGLKSLSRRQGATLFMTLLAIFKALLHRYTGQEDILVGTPIAGRNKAEVEGLIGFFVNTLALRSRFTGESRFSDLLTSVREAALGAYAHQEAPFEKLVEEIQPERDTSHSPLFQAMFVMQNNALPSVELPGLRVEAISVPSEFSNFDLALVAEEASRGLLSIDFCYNSHLFNATTIKRMAAHFETLLEAVIADPQRRLSHLPLLSDSERREMLTVWNYAEKSEVPPRCVHQLFEARVSETPWAMALVFGDEQVSYFELNRRANKLARYLRRLGAGPESRVGVCFDRGIEMVVSVLAALKAGGAYVPLDTAYPRERLAFVIEDAEAQIIVTHDAAAGKLPPHGARVVNVDSLQEEIDRESPENVESGVEPENLAYVIYTSGSTGRPKGALLRHLGVCNLADAQAQFFDVWPDSRVLQFASLSFDASVSEIFVTLGAGATLYLAAQDSVMPGKALAATLRDLEITVVTLPPVALGMTPAGELPNLGTVVTAGEACSAEVAAKWSEGRRLINAYGPTENTVCATMADCSDFIGKPPIGRAMTNTQVFLLDRNLEPVPVGVYGELYVGGTGLARGYLKRQELTAEKFIPHPFSTRSGDQLYGTGDIARFLPDGRIEFLGRADQQVKVRGVRVELGEVEAVLGKHHEVQDVVVVAHESAPGDKRLVAYVVPRREAFAPGLAGDEIAMRATEKRILRAQELRDYSEEHLPGYMIPSAFVTLDELPLTPSGKINRAALPAPDFAGAVVEDEYVAPRTPVEEVLAGIWADVIGVERVGIDDNFFEMGGHSMLATQVVSRAGDAFDIEAPLRWMFEHPTVAGMSEMIEEAIRVGKGVEAPPVEAVSRDHDLPLSFAQQRLWFIDQLEPGNAAYNILKMLRLVGRLDVRALEQALGALVERHEVLRTSFRTVEGQAAQVIAAPEPVNLPIRDLTHLDPDGQMAAARRMAAEESQYSFDLTTGPLMRVMLLRLKDEEHVLFVTMHHTISDGWSMDIFNREMVALYGAYSRGQSSPLEKLPIQYADYAAWQRQWLSGEALEKQLSYWRKQLGHDIQGLQLPVDRPYASTRDFSGARQTVLLTDELDASLRRLSRQQGSTLFMTLLAAFNILLRRYTGQEDILIGAPVAGRSRPETEGLIGFFVNNLVMHTSLAGNPSFQELLGRVREVALGAYAHQDIPFEKLVEELQPERIPGRNPFFDVMINYAGVSPAVTKPLGEVRGLIVDNLDLAEPSSAFPLTLSIADHGRGLVLQMWYQRALFTPERVASMLDQLSRLLEQIVEAPEAPIDSYSLVTSDSKFLLPDPTVALPETPQQFVTEMFFARASERPATVAVSQGDRTWTYEEMDWSVRSLSGRLLKEGAQPGEVVAVTGARSFGLIVGMMAAFSSRGVLLSIDPALPPEYKRVMLRESGARYLLYIGELRPEDAWMREDLSLPIMNVDPGTGRAFGEASSIKNKETIDLPRLEEGDPAYVFFTSGTTGAPKGILGRHKSLSHFLTWQRDRFAIGPQDRSGQLTGLSFDVVLRDIFTPLISGATLCLPGGHENLGPEQILEWLERERVTLLHTVPSLAQFWLTNKPEGVSLRRLRCLFFAGEPLTGTLIRRWREAFPEAGEIINLYGPTETTLAKCFYPTPAEPSPGVQPVGRPLPQTQALVLGSGDRLCGVGEVGEIAIRTPFRSLGYINAAAEDRARFVKNPFSEDESDLIYRTGDRGRYRPDGELDILGRVDHQVKIRGIRIEPGEIETVLRGRPGVSDVVVVAREEASGEKYLAAYVVLEEGEKSLVTEGDLKRFTGDRLPQSYVPMSFVFLDQLPLTANGKVDRRALPEPELDSSEVEGAYVAPGTPVEEMLAGIWAEALGLDQVGVHSNFFDLGGHSLLVTKAIFRIRTAFGIELPVNKVFEQPTIAELARTVENLMRAEREEPQLSYIEPLPRTGHQPTSSGQELTLSVAKKEGRFSYYSRLLRLTGHLDVAAMERALSEIVRRHEILRTTFETIHGENVQVVHPPQPWKLWPVDISGLPRAEHEAKVMELADIQMQEPFDVTRGPLFRTTLVKLGEDEHALLYTILHVICDMESLLILKKEMAAHYKAFSQGLPSTLPDLPIQYGDFAEWERRWLNDGVLEAERSFWRRQLEGAPTVLRLTTDRPRPPVQTFGGETQSILLPDSLHRSVKSLCQRESVTLYMALLAAFNVLLNRYTGQEDILVGTATSGRLKAEVEKLIGQFINLIIMRTKLHGDPTFRELLTQTREAALMTYIHQVMPIWALVQEFVPDPDPSYPTLVQVGFAMHHHDDPSRESEGIESSIISIESGRAPFDLLLRVNESPEELDVMITYNVDLFERDTIDRMLGHFQTLLEGIVEDVGRRISELPIYDEDSRRQLTV